jgi:hypothetical protein
MEATTDAAPERSHERVIEHWMLTIATDGGINRYDDLHADEIDGNWMDRNAWVDAGIQAHRIAIALRDKHQLPFIIALGFSLQSGEGLEGVDFQTTGELAVRLDWSPPSLYLFDSGGTPRAETERAVAEKAIDNDAVIQP